jgi:hypothetical protein
MPIQVLPWIDCPLFFPPFSYPSLYLKTHRFICIQCSCPFTGLRRTVLWVKLLDTLILLPKPCNFSRPPCTSSSKSEPATLWATNYHWYVHSSISFLCPYSPNAADIDWSTEWSVLVRLIIDSDLSHMIVGVLIYLPWLRTLSNWHQILKTLGKCYNMSTLWITRCQTGDQVGLVSLK